MLRCLALSLAASVALSGLTAPTFAAEPAAPIAAPPPPNISVLTAEPRELVASVTVTGTLTPRETVTVGADVDGLRVRELLVDEGDEVKAGQVLARLETDMIDVNLARSASQVARAEAAIQQAKAAITEAEPASVEADASLKRTRALSDKGIVGQDVLDTRISAAATAAARLASARQNVALSEADLAATRAERAELELRRSKAEIRAPTDGLVLRRVAQLGQIVSAAGGGLFEIARDGLVELDADVSETALGTIRKGEPAEVTAAGGIKSQGEVRLVSPRVEQASRLGRVRIALPKEAALRVGAFARAVIETDRSTGVTVPRTAVNTGPQGDFVQVVSNGVVATRTVTTGVSTGSAVEIRSGLQAGESVVAVAGTFVRDGDKVTPVPVETLETAEAKR
ncbi:MFP transporter [Aureimonas ureilytica]|uniref:MFP transporter n=1 Tax=Aureimonas ureilytica TaxID=401562 RepID=A0A175R7T1_9HYPH|nr:efflux RND transporter periplasmic adaptor subunit [Aureimonas ureilytica]KTQ95385.1 MFP transporter [Aureimonas ureilytica]